MRADDGAMAHHRIHQLGGGFGRAGADQLGQLGEFLDILGGDDAAGAFHHGEARLPLASGGVCHSAKGRFSTTVTVMASG